MDENRIANERMIILYDTMLRYLHISSRLTILVSKPEYSGLIREERRLPMSSGTMLSIVQGTCILDFQEQWSQLPAQFQWCRVVENANMVLGFLKKIQHDKC